MLGQAGKPTFENFLIPTLKKFGGEKSSNFADLPPTRRQSEARYFEMAQYIDKQKLDLLSTINALKMVTNLGHHPTGF